MQQWHMLQQRLTCAAVMGMRITAFKCPALQDLRDKRPHLFEGTQADAIYDTIHVAR